MDTIVAVSSPPLSFVPETNAALPLAIVRLSGPRAMNCADAVCKIAQPENPSVRAKKSATKIPATLVEVAAEKRWRRVPCTVRWRGQELSARVYVMPSPRSYTREDVAELHVPGMPWLVEELIDALVAAGARPAQAGEFTRRAFENGRITLEQAAAVGKLIASSTAAEARAHAGSLATHAGVKRRQLKADLEDLLAKVELGLDFSHEDVVVISLDELAARLREMRSRAEKLAGESARDFERRLAARVPRIVLAGPTNAGKSRLFNALLKRDAAIVSAERHTTRDAVEAQTEFGATLIDSAGVGWSCTAPIDAAAHNRRSATPPYEIHAAARATTLRELERADILLLALDRSVPLGAQEELPALLEELRKLKPAASALVWTKSDLQPAPNWRADANMWEGRPGPQDFTTRFEVSSLTGEGIDTLRSFLRARTVELSQRTAEAHAAAGAALRGAAREAADALERAEQALADIAGEDVVAVELREAIHAFWRAEGILLRHDAVTEAALDKIFAEFCIGK